MKLTVVVGSMTVTVAVLCPTVVEARMKNRSRENSEMALILN